MLRALRHGLLVSSLLFSSASAIDHGYSRCNCDNNSQWIIESILQCQKVSDFLIASAYFSIPLELLYFVTCSQLFLFKWVFIQFGAFIVLCGITHLLNVFTYEPHSFLLMLSLSISKFFTALVSFATAVTLLTLIPQLLRVKVRENFLRLKAWELKREVGKIKRQEETSWHVGMLTQEIRKSLDRHTILYTTMVELSTTLGLQNCVVWVPDREKKEMGLSHELKPRNSYSHSVPIDDPDVREIKANEGLRVLGPESLLGFASSGEELEHGAVSAIRMPMLKVSNFKGGTPELIKTCYAILVLVLPKNESRVWSKNELEIIKVVADQVAVALSHAAVLEESQLMRDKLTEQNQALLRAKQDAVMVSEAMNSFHKAMGQGMKRPIHSILGLLSMMQQQQVLNSDQRLLVNAMVQTVGVVSTLTNDALESNTINSEWLTLEMRPFNLHSMIKEAASVSRCLCDSKEFGFGIQIDNAVTDLVIGDEKRTFHVILHMVGSILGEFDQGFLTFRVVTYNEVEDRNDQGWFPWKSNFSHGYTCVKFEIGIKRYQSDDSSSSGRLGPKPNPQGLEMGLSFNMCKKLVQMMQGNIWAIRNSEGLTESITLLAQFQLQPPLLTPTSELRGSFENHHHFKGVRVVLADSDSVNRAVTRKILESLGCHVTSVSSGAQCLASLGAFGTPFQLLILDVDLPEMDGFQVATRIRKLSSGCWPLIVGLATSAGGDVRQRCSQSGINGLIQKPVTMQVMGRELYKVLHNL